MRAVSIPLAFFSRRIHSLSGLCIAAYLFEHLYVNSQAGISNLDFIQSVNGIQLMPYLHVFEICLIGLPIVLHMYWGIGYLRQAAYNSFRTDGTKPSLPRYSRNHAYTWQRGTAWILLFGIILHVYHMRFKEYPEAVGEGHQTAFYVPVDSDQKAAAGLDVQIEERGGKRVAKAKDFGTAELIVVRSAFTSPLLIALYTLFVLSACFHGYNGLWTFCCSWGFMVTEKAQRYMLRFCYLVMAVVTCLGLIAIYGTYLSMA